MHFSRGECLLQYWLDHRGITQAEYARRSGWDKRIVSYWCNNERKMSVEAMYTASVLLEIEMSQLYNWKLEASESRSLRK